MAGGISKKRPSFSPYDAVFYLVFISNAGAGV
jgi:hypothetical protein